MKRFAAICIVLFAVAALGQESAAPSNETKPAAHTGSPGFRAEVQKMADDWREAFKAKDADKIASTYTDDAVWVTPEGTFHGSADIKNQLKKMMDRGDTVDSIITGRTVRGGDLAYAEGTFSGKSPDPSGQERQGHGSWVVTLKKSNDKWLAATHTSVSLVSAAKAVKKPK